MPWVKLVIEGFDNSKRIFWFSRSKIRLKKCGRVAKARIEDGIEKGATSFILEILEPDNNVTQLPQSGLVES